MYYLAWIISAGLAVTVGCYVASKIDKKERNNTYYLARNTKQQRSESYGKVKAKSVELSKTDKRQK